MWSNRHLDGPGDGNDWSLRFAGDEFPVLAVRRLRPAPPLIFNLTSMSDACFFVLLACACLHASMLASPRGGVGGITTTARRLALPS